MANFFQPGPSQSSGTSSTTPSPEQQALMKFRLELLGRLLDASAGNRPTFKSFVGGGPATTPLPAGLGAGIGSVLQAASQPGAFTTTSTTNQKAQGPSTSMANDLAQLATLGILAKNLGLFSGLGSLGSNILGRFGDTGAVQGASGTFANSPPGINANQPALQNQDNMLGALGGMFGSDNQIPMATAGQSDQDFLASLLNLY
jgi:hypothetical protein